MVLETMLALLVLIRVLFETLVCQSDTVGGGVSAPSGATATDCPGSTTIIR